MQPGEYLLAEDDIVINRGRAVANWLCGTPATARCKLAATTIFTRSIQRSSSIARQPTECTSIFHPAPPHVSSQATKSLSR